MNFREGFLSSFILQYSLSKYLNPTGTLCHRPYNVHNVHITLDGRWNNVMCQLGNPLSSGTGAVTERICLNLYSPSFPHHDLQYFGYWRKLSKCSCQILWQIKGWTANLFFRYWNFSKKSTPLMWNKQNFFINQNHFVMSVLSWFTTWKNRKMIAVISHIH